MCLVCLRVKGKLGPGDFRFAGLFFTTFFTEFVGGFSRRLCSEGVTSCSSVTRLSARTRKDSCLEFYIGAKKGPFFGLQNVRKSRRAKNGLPQ